MRRLVIVIFIVLVGAIGVNFYWNYLLSAPNTADTKTEVFVVYKGEATQEIAQRLEKEGLIRSASAFNLLAKMEDGKGMIQAGDFKLSKSMSAHQVLETLKTGLIDKWVTLLEGWRVEEMAVKLNSELGIDRSEFLKEAEEGYMFPDTYLFNTEASAATVAQTIRSTFEQRYSEDLKTKIRRLGLTDDEGVKLASIVEREARSPEARRMVASILLKRLNIGMGLNADATIQYALVPVGAAKPPSFGWWKRSLTKSDLQIDSPFNSYIHAGLPPTPICNPSLSSLKAVSEADPKTPYLYYYHDSQGISRYGRTLEEHNQNISKYP